MLLERLLAAAAGDLCRPLAQLCDELTHPRPTLLERVRALGLRGEYGHALTLRLELLSDPGLRLQPLELGLEAFERLGRLAPGEERQELALVRVLEPERDAAVERETVSVSPKPPEISNSVLLAPAL